MDIDRYIARNNPDWERLRTLTDKAGTSASRIKLTAAEVGEGYRAAFGENLW